MMVDFRSSSERQFDEHKSARTEQNYKAAFESARQEIDDLKLRMTELADQNVILQTQLSELTATQSENIRQVRAQIETGMAKLAEDNSQMHAMIQSSQTEDLKLVEQMDRNHRERLESIVRLVDQQGLSNG